MGELHLGLEVADCPQAANDELGAAGTAEVDGQPVEGGDFDPIGTGTRAARRKRLTDDVDPHLDRQEGLFARVGEDADDDSLEHAGGAPDHVEVAVRDRVERARVDRDAHRSSSRR